MSIGACEVAQAASDFIPISFLLSGEAQPGLLLRHQLKLNKPVSPDGNADEMALTIGACPDAAGGVLIRN